MAENGDLPKDTGSIEQDDRTLALSEKALDRLLNSVPAPNVSEGLQVAILQAFDRIQEANGRSLETKKHLKTQQNADGLQHYNSIIDRLRRWAKPLTPVSAALAVGALGFLVGSISSPSVPIQNRLYTIAEADALDYFTIALEDTLSYNAEDSLWIAE
ncbi:MAG: hypothetical protein AAF720_13910 [Pseudomonadota bacterium]